MCPKDLKDGKAIWTGMPTERSPTVIERTLSLTLSLSPVFGFPLGIYYLTYPFRGFKILGRDCILTSTAVTIVVIIALLVQYHVVFG
jgi:hypothetical protein